MPIKIHRQILQQISDLSSAVPPPDKWSFLGDSSPIREYPRSSSELLVALREQYSEEQLIQAKVAVDENGELLPAPSLAFRPLRFLPTRPKSQSSPQDLVTEAGCVFATDPPSREFDPGQAFWLAIVLKLKQVGLKTPLAANVANYANRALRGATQNLNWDFRFLPEQGWFDTEHQYYIEVGDLKWIRLVTDANPSQKGELHSLAWHPVEGKKRRQANVRPFVTLRVDLARIAAVLNQVESWSRPDDSARERPAP